MPRGGRRTGTPGASYANRTDLAVPAAAATGQQYGKASQQLAAQRAMPVARPSTDRMPMTPTPGGAQPMGGPQPGQLTPLDAPSSRPNEPITAGLPVGAGPGIEANPFGMVGSDDDAQLAIRAAYAAYPSEDLRAYLEGIDLDG